MKIVIAPNSFKGSLSAVEAAAAMRDGIAALLPDAAVIEIPVADGGDGTAEVLVAGTGGRFIDQPGVRDPLSKPRTATFGLLGDGQTAVVEMASASGLRLIQTDQLNPLIASTYGTGQLITACLDRSCTRIIIGVGGSATVDGGTGMAQALGIRLLDVQGNDLPGGGASLQNLSKIDISGLDLRLRNVEIVVACDVENPLVGPDGAPRIFGPQKGATPEMVEQLEASLTQYAQIVERDLGKRIIDVPRGGAAGGLAAGLLALLNGQLVSGIDLILDVLKFDAQVKDADLVITGEGKIDAQTVAGKAPIGVALAAKKYGIPVIALAGNIGDDADIVYSKGIDALASIMPRPMPLDEAMHDAHTLIRTATERAIRLMLIGKQLSNTNTLA